MRRPRVTVNRYLSLTGIISVLVLGAGTLAAASAQDDSAKRASALQYLAATHAEQKLKQGIDAIIPSLVRSLKQTHRTITPAQLEKFRQSLQARLTANMAAIKDVQVSLLTRTFSLKELREAAGYQSSPTGQHFQAVSFELLAQISARRQQLFSEAYEAAIKDAAVGKGDGPKAAAPSPQK